MSNPKNLTQDQQIEVLYRALRKCLDQLSVIRESTELGDETTVYQAVHYVTDVIDDSLARVTRPNVQLPEDDLSEIPW